MKLILFVLTYFAGWVAYFMLLQRPLFALYNRQLSSAQLKWADFMRAERYGFKTDAISAAYLTALPLLMAIAQSWVSTQFLPEAMVVYNALAGTLISLATVADTALFRFWQHKLDASVLAYLKTLRWAIASVTGTYLFFAAIALTATVIITVCWMQWLTGLTLRGDTGGEAYGSTTGIVLAILAALLLIGATVAVIRGLRSRPNNPSLAFHSPVQFFNYVALSPLYSFIYSLSVNEKIEGAFHSMPDEEAEQVFRSLFPTDSGDSVERLLNTTRPNVLYVMWESLCARFVGELGGRPDVTPAINRLAREGVWFSRVDSSSFRTDRALVALLSGYPGQPTTSAIRMTAKLPNLPAFPRRFRELGYETTAVHGGNTTAFHMNEYFLTIGHERTISEPDFPSSLSRDKWGVVDGELMDWLYDDIMDKTRRRVQWYTSVLTLTSHEPWTVPYSRIADDPVANSFAYVDEAFGRFVERLRQSPAWDNLLVIVTGDHGCNKDGTPVTHEEYAHIPLLLLGGAVREPRRIDKIVSQTDIPATILGQMGLDHSEFTFSRDVMASTYTYPCSFHSFINGFMFRDETGATVVDNVTDTVESGPDPTREHRGRAILQYLYTDLARR